MPFLRFSRDKRGYEHTYLVNATTRRGKPTRPRILYWYRTPPGVRLGRVPFPEEVRKAIEAQNPGIVFDWPTLASTPFPSQEPEFWRERRRAEKAAKQARREEEATDTGDAGDDGSAQADSESSEFDDVVAAPAEPLLAGESEDAAAGDDDSVPVQALGADGTAESPVDGAAAPGGETAAQAHRRRRRRGGRRRRGRNPGEGAGATGESPAAEAGDRDPGDHEQITESAPSTPADSASEDQE